jgi:hypothetical protein
MTRASQVVRQLGEPDPLAGFVSSAVPEYHLPDDAEPVGAKWEEKAKSQGASLMARLHITAMY